LLLRLWYFFIAANLWIHYSYLTLKRYYVYKGPWFLWAFNNSVKRDEYITIFVHPTTIHFTKTKWNCLSHNLFVRNCWSVTFFGFYSIVCGAILVNISTNYKSVIRCRKSRIWSLNGIKWASRGVNSDRIQTQRCLEIVRSYMAVIW